MFFYYALKIRIIHKFTVFESGAECTGRRRYWIWKRDSREIYF